MKTENSHSRNQMLEKRLDLLRREVAGQLVDLPCPDCGQNRIAVWYTHPAPADFRTWFVCDNCRFEMRAQNTDQPQHYSLDRDRTGHPVAT